MYGLLALRLHLSQVPLLDTIDQRFRSAEVVKAGVKSVKSATIKIRKVVNCLVRL